MQGLVVVTGLQPRMQTQTGIRRFLLHLPPQQTQQRRLAAAVTPHHRHPIAAFQARQARGEQGRQTRLGRNGELFHLQQSVSPQHVAAQRQPPGRSIGELGLALLQALNLLFHLLGFAREIFVIIRPAPDGQPFSAGGDPVDLLLLRFMAQRVAGVLGFQRLTGGAAGQGEGVQGSVAQDPTGISYSIQ